MLDKTSGDPSQGVTTDVPAVGVTIQSQVNPRRSIVLQTFIGRDEGTREFHALTDKLSSVIDRQEAKYDLIGAQDKLAADQRSLDLGEAQFVAIGVRSAEEWKAKRKQGEPQLSASERIAKDNVAQSIKAGRASVERLKQEIKELEAKIAKVD